ncbi:MAG: peptide chain release factor N(5)-glutamine methyltransferase [Eubacteriales bacterium]
MAISIREAINVATTRLTVAESESPKLDAEVLLAYFLKVDRSFLFAHYADDLDEKRSDSFFEIIDRRASGMPVAYIIGRKEFMGISFKVNENVLIPRPDTEIIVEETIKIANEHQKGLGNLEILDLCCGSGAIAVSLAYYLNKAKLTATDISSAALNVARENAKDYKLSGKIKFVQGDLFSPFRSKGLGKTHFDMIISNPPYIKSEVISTLQREILEHEPMIALDGGESGLDFYIKIIEKAPDFLKKNGYLILEIGHDQKDQILQLLDKIGQFREYRVAKDLAGHDRVVIAQK